MVKFSDAIVWPKHWTTQLGNEIRNTPLENGILTDIRAWEDTSTIILIVSCRGGKYYGLVHTDRNHYETVLQFLSTNKKRTLREIKQAGINFPEPVY